VAIVPAGPMTAAAAVGTGQSAMRSRAERTERA